MTQVTKESLEKRIKSLETTQRVFGLSLQAEYNLKAYRMLLQLMDSYAELQERYDLDVNPEGK